MPKPLGDARPTSNRIVGQAHLHQHGACSTRYGHTHSVDRFFLSGANFARGESFVLALKADEVDMTHSPARICEHSSV